MSLSAARCPAQSVILSFKGRNLVEVKKSTNLCAKLSLNYPSLKGQGGVLREFGC